LTSTNIKFVNYIYICVPSKLQANVSFYTRILTVILPATMLIELENLWTYW